MYVLGTYLGTKYMYCIKILCTKYMTEMYLTLIRRDINFKKT